MNMKKEIRQKYRLIYSEMRVVMPSLKRQDGMPLSLRAITLQVFGYRMNSCPSDAETRFCKCSENRGSPRKWNGTRKRVAGRY
jgi:hypothetical protein